MAKKTRTKEEVSNHPGGQPTVVESGGSVEGRVVDFAENLGKLLGHAQNQAQSWIGQREAVMKQLESIRDTATGLLSQLGHTAGEQLGKISRRGRPKKYVAPDSNPAGALKPEKKKKGRAITAAGRAAISAAQKARWAQLKAVKKP
jgi:hypothetical protein